MPAAKEQLFIASLDAADPTVGRWLGALADTRRRTHHALEGIADPVVNWRSPDGLTIGSVLYHVAAIEVSWLYEDVLAGQAWTPELEAMFPYPVRDGQEHLTVVPDDSFAHHRRRLDRMRDILLDIYRAMTLDDFRRPRSLPDYDMTPEWVLIHLINHEAEHRGQINALREAAEKTLR